MQSLTPPSDRSRKYSLDDFKKSGSSGSSSSGGSGQPKGSAEREHTSDLSFLHEKGKPSDRQGKSGGGAEEHEQEQETSGETAQSSAGSPRKRSPEDRERRRIMVAKKLRKVRLVACGENTTMVLLGTPATTAHASPCCCLFPATHPPPSLSVCVCVCDRRVSQQ
jgi:hypothetical protein